MIYKRTNVVLKLLCSLLEVYMNAAGKTSLIFSSGTNIRYFMQSKGDAITGGASVSVSVGICKPCMARFVHSTATLF